MIRDMPPTTLSAVAARSTWLRRHAWTRRDFLYGGTATLVTVSVTACDGAFSTDPPEGAGNGSGDQAKGREAPMLAALVEEGELPPINERLPATPLVLEPVDRVGVYGGEWRTMLSGVADVPWIGRTIDYDHPLTWDRELTESVPNLAESVEANDEGTVFTIHLRQGVRWSDGEPFDADDIVFAYEDRMGNTEISPVHPAWLSAGAAAGGAPATLEKMDDYTLRFTFDEPNGLFITYLTDLAGGGLVNSPRHYLEQFHIDYNPDVEAMAEEEGYADWVELFNNRANKWQNVGVPVLTPWMTEQALGDGPRFVVTRNPYYWKVDPDGSQLPYLDRVVYEIVEDTEVMLLKVTNGEIDMHSRHVNIPANKPILANSREDGDYDFFDIETTDTNQMSINLNLTHQDEASRDLFQTKEFRIGLSHAINRDEIINVVFQRQGEPWQVAPRPESPFYDEEYGTQYLEYDVDLANQILDDAGFAERDGDGIRLHGEGQPIRFNVEVAVPSLVTGWDSAMELVRDYWLDVGVDARVNSSDRSLMWERMTSNQHDASVWIGEFGDLDAILYWDAYTPFGGNVQFAVGWGQWYATGGTEGMEPPETVQHQMRLYDEVKATVDDEERRELFQQVLAISRDQFYNIGIAMPAVGYGIVKNTFHNVPQTMPGSRTTPAPTRAEQYFTQG